jgi:hypothetical protein
MAAGVGILLACLSFTTPSTANRKIWFAIRGESWWRRRFTTTRESHQLRKRQAKGHDFSRAINPQKKRGL